MFEWYVYSHFREVGIVIVIVSIYKGNDLFPNVHK